MDQTITRQLDTQQIEILGRSYLISLCVGEGIEVAVPIRDHGVDLIIYKDTESLGNFRAVPIQLKAFSHERFSVDKKFKKFPNLVMAYVWHAVSPQDSLVYVMTYEEAEVIAGQLSGYYALHDKYSTNSTPRLRELLSPYLYTQGLLTSKYLIA